MSDTAEDEPSVPSSPLESFSLVSLSSSLLSSAASSSASTSDSLAFLAAIVAARFEPESSLAWQMSMQPWQSPH